METKKNRFKDFSNHKFHRSRLPFARRLASNQTRRSRLEIDRWRDIILIQFAQAHTRRWPFLYEKDLQTQ